jgi:class 3 adenylate cyclase/tetratricopeptide (TPR) repeat protein
LLPEAPIFCDHCGYQVSPIAAIGRQWVDQETQSVPPSPGVANPIDTHSPILDRQSSTPVAQPSLTDSRAQEATSTVSPLQQYIPKELMAKLEAAHASGMMAGERRTVTMLFCDVKGSTLAAEQLDPEEWTEVINGALEHMIKPVYEYEGTVARLMGDAILAFFGAPIAHEDDPQRAVLAGLAMINSLNPFREMVQRRFGLDFNVRVGINTGPVVVGAVGSDLRMEYTAMGNAINLASRMEQTAQPGTVQIAHDTYKLVAPLFEIEELGGIEVKGKDIPVQAYRVLSRKTQAGRLRGIAGLEVPLVGRTTEMSSLTDAFEKVQKGVGGIVSLIGEAGLGKSRLIRELKPPASNSSEVSWLETSSQSYETSQPYNLFRRLIRRVVDAAPNESGDGLQEKISIFSNALPEGQEQTQRVFESLFGLSSAEGEPPLMGETFKQLFLAATRNLWQARAREQPTVLVCDDLHWADTASVELLSQMFALTEKVPLLIVCSLRPERRSPGWQLKSKADSEYLHRYTEILLRPLSEDDSSQLLTNLALGAEIPSRLHQRIMEKAAGIPYYLEEVVRGLMDSQALIRENGAFRWAAAEDVTDFDLPDSLQSLLVARIDRLEENARRTLQLASVVGRSFYYRVLARMEDTTRTLDHQLDILVRDNMIREAAREPELEYIFSNVLTQEAAYRTILLRHRRQFHLQVGEALEALFPDRQEELAPVLAVHFSEAGEDKRTLKYRTQAGDAAYRMYALDEAIDHYNRALKIAVEGEEIEGVSEQLVYLYTRLGRAYELLYQYEHVQETYEEMRTQAERRGDKALMLAYLIVLGTVMVTYTPLVDPERGQALAKQALTLANELGDRRAEAKAHWNIMLLHRFYSLDMEAGKYHGEISLEIARELAWDEQIAFILNDLSMIYMGLLDLPKALSVLEEAREYWQYIGNMPMLTDNLGVAGLFYIFAGDFDQAQEIIGEGIQVAESIGNHWNGITLRGNLSDCYLERGEIGKALENIHVALAVGETMENENLLFLLLLKLAANYAELGLVERGLEVCERLLTLDFGSPATRRVIEWIHALQARLHLANNDLDNAKKTINKFQPLVSQVTIFPYVDNVLSLVTCEVMLASQEYPQVLKLTEEFIPHNEIAGMRQWLADQYLYQGLAFFATEDTEKARSSLLNARSIAEEIGSRRILWKIYAALAEVEEHAGNSLEAEKLWGKAGEIIDYIVDHTGGEENRASFLARTDIQKVVGK